MAIDIEVSVGGLRQKFIDGCAPAPEYLQRVFALVGECAEIEERFGDLELEDYLAERRT